ncbi:hypothetical protein MLD38_037648 [Melastoma candidum]|uniref:Uncharacterized protein n=1 Tax=Melastoma candidum TaxID=119954 RepID=A0ACB9LP35_9MYRT|nr:hypothetical protein MLD38_037648 [Melastoma candidum]
MTCGMGQGGGGQVGDDLRDESGEIDMADGYGGSGRGGADEVGVREEDEKMEVRIGKEECGETNSPSPNRRPLLLQPITSTSSDSLLPQAADSSGAFPAEASFLIGNWSGISVGICNSSSNQGFRTHGIIEQLQAIGLTQVIQF